MIRWHRAVAHGRAIMDADGDGRRRILLVSPWWYPVSGGVVRSVGAVARALIRSGASVTVLARTSLKSESGVAKACRTTGLNVRYVYLRPVWSETRVLKTVLVFLAFLVPTVWRLLRVIRENGIDVVGLAYLNQSYVYFPILRWVTKLDYFVWIHGSDVNLAESLPSVERLALRVVLGWARSVVGVCHDLVERVETIFPNLQIPKMVIPTCVDELEFSSPHQVGDVPERYILCTFPLRRPKRPDIVLDAFALVVRRLPGVSLVFAGDGPERATVARLADELGLQGRVRLYGWVSSSELAYLYRQCEFTVLASDREGLPNCILESLYFGKPVVATAVNGIPEVVRSGVNGLLVPPGDVNELATALSAMLADGEKRTAMGEAGRRLVEQGYLSGHVASAYLREFKRITSVRSVRLRGPGSRDVRCRRGDV